MSQPLTKKLQIRPGSAIRLLHTPDGFKAALDPLPHGARIAEDGEDADAVILFVRDRAELDRWGPEAIRLAEGDKLLWIAYPKGSSGVPTDINRDRGWDVVRDAGLRGVRQIAIDETWSALRFRPREPVGSSR